MKRFERRAARAASEEAAGGEAWREDEYLEYLWYARERGEALSEPELTAEGGPGASRAELDRLIADGYVEAPAAGVLRLASRGEERAVLLVRSHRLAERLVHDVLGSAYEEGACEFEHILNHEIVDSICTLLGHPRECPHGMPIPPGECCRTGVETVPSSVVPLTRIGVGVKARIAYVYGETDRQLHKLDNLQIRPGVEVRVHQCSPSFVIDCQGSTIALDERVAANIHVWAPRTPPSSRPGRGDNREHDRFRHRHRHGSPADTRLTALPPTKGSLPE